MSEALEKYKRCLRKYNAFYEYLQPILDEKFPMKDNPQNIPGGAIILPHPDHYKIGDNDMNSPERMATTMTETMEFYKARLSTFDLTHTQTTDLTRIISRIVEKEIS